MRSDAIGLRPPSKPPQSGKRRPFSCRLLPHVHVEFYWQRTPFFEVPGVQMMPLRALIVIPSAIPGAISAGRLPISERKALVSPVPAAAVVARKQRRASGDVAAVGIDAVIAHLAHWAKELLLELDWASIRQAAPFQALRSVSNSVAHSR